LEHILPYNNTETHAGASVVMNSIYFSYFILQLINVNFSRMVSEVIGEALQTQCRKCTEKQKVLLDRLVDWYTTNQPEQWEAFIKKTIENAQRKND